MPWAIVAASCLGMFAATSTGSTRAPFLPDMAQDLQVSLPAVANLFGVTATAWGVSSWLVGLVSDRLGRKAFLIFSPLALALAMLAISQANSYGALLALVVFGGCCCGAFTTTAMAEVSVQADPSMHGRAFGYVLSGQSLTLLFGVPMAAWFGSMTGWRGTHVALAVMATVAAFATFAALRGVQSRDVTVAGKKRMSTRDALTAPIKRLFVALIAERMAFGLAAFYYASYLRTAYDLPIEAVALPLVGFALGNIAGTLIGGQVADRFAYRRLSFAIAVSIAGFIAIPWVMWQPGLLATTITGITFAFSNAVARPPLLAALADVPKESRGIVMGLNSSIASVGSLAAALIGGWFYAGIGFVGFGPLMSLMCIASALIVLPDSRMMKSTAVT